MEESIRNQGAFCSVFLCFHVVVLKCVDHRNDSDCTASASATTSNN